MEEKPNNTSKEEKGRWSQDYRSFDSVADFSGAIEKATGLVLDLPSVVALNTHFIEATEQFILLNVKDFTEENSDNLLFITESVAYLCSRKSIPRDSLQAYVKVLDRPLGVSTVLTFTLFDYVLAGYHHSFEELVTKIRDMEQSFDHSSYRHLSTELERFSDRLEEFHDLLLRLQETRYKYLQMKLISFDYSVLLAECSSLEGRARRRLSVLRDLRMDFEMQATDELNQRVVRLNDIVKKLTAFTVILMVPTLISSHFGMNFVFMPELKMAWTYPAVIVIQIALAGTGFIIFRRIGWL